MNIELLRIFDKACTVCDGIDSNGKTISKKRCDECIKNNKLYFRHLPSSKRSKSLVKK